jgi:hypothetical protein
MTVSQTPIGLTLKPVLGTGTTVFCNWLASTQITVDPMNPLSKQNALSSFSSVRMVLLYTRDRRQ